MKREHSLFEVHDADINLFLIKYSIKSVIGKRASVYVVRAILLLGMSLSVNAAPWMEPSDTRLRHSIQVLADAGLIRVPINTWPLMWSGVISEVNMVRGGILSPSQRRASDYVLSEFQRQTDHSSYILSAQAANQPAVLPGFADSRREKAEVAASAELMGEDWAGRVRLTWAQDPQDDRQYRADGSYVSKLLGNWALSIGSVDRWWGPAWQSALIMSNNARPVPGVTLQRNGSEPFETALLRWLGPWQLVMFAGQLEKERTVANAKLLGARFGFRPLSWLELGVSRTAQWGGDGRKESWDSFQNLLEQGPQVGDPASVAGNRLLGIDWRTSWSNDVVTADFYGEVVGEYESSGRPSRSIVTLGMGATMALKNSDLRLYLESSDTASGRAYTKPRYNVAYEHDVYRSGYRYRGKSLGASMDNDSRVQHIAVQWYPSSQNSLSLKVSHYALKTSGTADSVAMVDSSGIVSSAVFVRQHKAWRYTAKLEHYGDLALKGLGSAQSSVEIGFSYQLQSH